MANNAAPKFWGKRCNFNVLFKCKLNSLSYLLILLSCFPLYLLIYHYHLFDTPKSADVNISSSSSLFVNISSVDSNKLRQNTEETAITKTTKYDVVIGIAQDTDPKNLAVFQYSFREINQQAEVYLFVNEPFPTQSKVIANECNITLLSLEHYRKSANIESFIHFHPSTTRWPVILTFLKQPHYVHRFRRVLFIDVRDSYFQKDPFLTLPLPFPPMGLTSTSTSTNKKRRFFHVFTGVESIRLKVCGWNGDWVKDCFNNDILNQIGDKNIICSGVTLADIDSAIDYLERMAAIITHSNLTPGVTNDSIFKNLQLVSKFPSCERNGVDQGVHNVLVHTGALSSSSSSSSSSSLQSSISSSSSLKSVVTIFKQTDGPVANMQSKIFKLETIPSTGEKKVQNLKGELFSIVPQYDRQSELQSYLFKKYVKWMDSDDIEGEWKNDLYCSTYFTTPQYDIDPYKGRCDLESKGGATSPVSCCKICHQYSYSNSATSSIRSGKLNSKFCQAFVYLSGTCFLKSCSSSNSDGNGRSNQREVQVHPFKDAWTASLLLLKKT